MNASPRSPKTRTSPPPDGAASRRFGGARSAPRADIPSHTLGSDLDVAPREGCYGCLERIDAVGMTGWVLDATDLDLPQPVRVLLDGVQIFAGQAKLMRADVSELMGRHARCGFEFRWCDIQPQSRLPDPWERKGVLQVLTANRAALPIAAPVPGAEIYRWADFYLDRLALVLGVSEVVAPVQLDDRRLVEREFDPAYYRAMHPDAVGEDDDPLEHFMSVGWRLGHDPHPEFSVRYYLAANVDVASSDMNPYVHFLRAGRAEGRMGMPPGGFRFDVLREQRSLDQTITLWRRADSFRALSARSLTSRLEEYVADRGGIGLVVSISHDDYTRHVGGIQLCLAKEQRAFNDQGMIYLHLSPWQALPVLAPPAAAERTALRVLCDGSEIGYATAADVASALGMLRERFAAEQLHFVVHALHGHATEAVVTLHRALQPARALFWLHDFFSLCTGYNLLRNQIQYCHCPPLSSAACAVCVFGESRESHLERIQALFEAIPFTAVAPSPHTSALWRRLTSLPVRDVVVHEHCSVLEDGRRIAPALDDSGVADAGRPTTPLRVAFLGHPVVHKGWPVFRNLVRRMCSDDRYEFWHLGTAAEDKLPLHFREVKVGPAEPDAMVRALDEAAIDVVVQWSIWPETFGIAARECAAAGVYLVASSASGAVAEYVRDSERGLLVDTERALVALFEGDDLVARAMHRRTHGVAVGHLLWGRLSADLLAPVRPASAMAQE